MNIVADYDYMHGKVSSGVRGTVASVMLTNEQMVKEYFNRISSKDVDGLLQLFADDAVVYEPFSKEDGLHGKSAIEHFLKVAIMANAGLTRRIEFVGKSDEAITAFVRFKRDGAVSGRFSFLFAIEEISGQKKIKELKIRFS